MYKRCALLLNSRNVQEQTTARRSCISLAGPAIHDNVSCISCDLQAWCLCAGIVGESKDGGSCCHQPAAGAIAAGWH